MTIDKDKAVNEIIDGYDAEAVPDNLVADRLDSAGYSLAAQLDTDGATVLLAGSTVTGLPSLSKDNIYDTIIDVRTAMSEANIPDDNKRYLLCTPKTIALILKCDEFTKASDLGDEVVQSGAVGRIGGFNVIEWNDTTANLAMIAGHPRFATRSNEWAVPVHLQDLSGSGKYIGASAIQGRNVYGHKVLRSVAIRACYSPGSLTLTGAQGSASGKTVLTVTGTTGSTFKYTKNPSTRAAYGDAYSSGADLTSGTTEIAVSAGDIIEVVELSSSAVINVGYITVDASIIK